MNNLFGASKIRAILSGQQGVALLMVLVVITILTIMVVSFTDTTQSHLYVTQYHKDRLQAYNTAKSGIQALAAVLRSRNLLGAADYDCADSSWHFESQPYQEIAMLLLTQPICGGSLIEPALLVPTRHEEQLIPIYLIDENSKLSLFHLITNPGKATETTNEVTFNRLSALLEILLVAGDLIPPALGSNTTTLPNPSLNMNIDSDQAERLAYYLVDWIDTENNGSIDFNGNLAEDQCPEDNLTYITKNGRLDSIDEIGLVCGFRQMGRPVIEKLSRYLTDHDLTTNLNTASHLVLTALFDAAGSADPLTEAETLYDTLHKDPNDPNSTIDPIRTTGSIRTSLINIGIDNTVAVELGRATAPPTIGVQSNYFRINLCGVMYDTETGTEQARSRLQAIMRTAGTPAAMQPQNLEMMYYRED